MQSSRKAVLILMSVAALGMSMSARAGAGDIDTEHIFGFMIGSDIGAVGEREFQSQTTGRFGKTGGRYRAGEQEFELEWVPAKDIRIEIGSSLSTHHIQSGPGLPDRRAFAWQGASIDVRYRFLDRETAPVGMTLAIDAEFSRVDETNAARIRGYGTGLTLAFDREIVRGTAVAALNLIYQPEWTRHLDAQRLDRDSALGVSLGVMMQARAGLLLGGEARYLRRYEGTGLEELAGQALFLGPTAYVQLSDRSRLTASWSAQVWGRSGQTATALDLVNFERHQLRLTYGANF